MNDVEVKFPVIKIISAWFAAITTSAMTTAWDTFFSIPWGILAQFAAFVYSALLIWEILKKKFKKEPTDGSA